MSVCQMIFRCRRRREHILLTGPWAVIALVIGVFVPATGYAESIQEKWGAFIAGSLSTIAIHELGHMVVAESQNIDYEYDGVTIVYPKAKFTESKHLRIASAGFQAQWIASEIAFKKLTRQQPLRSGARSFSRGIVAGHAAITFAYLTFLKDHEDGDIAGMSQASGLSNDALALMVAIPALFDSWRLTADDIPNWVPKVSAGFKGLGIAAIWIF